MFCKQCGKEIPDGFSFCGLCGTPVDAPPSTPAQEVPQGGPHVRRKTRDVGKPNIPFRVKFMAFLSALRLTVPLRFKLLALFAVIVFAISVFNSYNRPAGSSSTASSEVTAPPKTNRQFLDETKHIIESAKSSADLVDASARLALIPANAPEAAEVKALQKQLQAKQKITYRQEAIRARQESVAQRDAMAKFFENSYLDKGYSVDVVATGRDHTTFHMKWALATKAFVHNFSKQTEFFEQAQSAGFKRVEITDGFDESWSWKLD